MGPEKGTTPCNNTTHRNHPSPHHCFLPYPPPFPHSQYHIHEPFRRTDRPGIQTTPCASTSSSNRCARTRRSSRGPRVCGSSPNSIGSTRKRRRGRPRAAKRYRSRGPTNASRMRTTSASRKRGNGAAGSARIATATPLAREQRPTRRRLPHPLRPPRRSWGCRAPRMGLRGWV